MPTAELKCVISELNYSFTELEISFIFIKYQTDTRVKRLKPRTLTDSSHTNTCGYNKHPSNLPDADCGPSPGGGGCRGGPPRAGSGWCRCRCVCACACVCVCAAAAAAATAADWCSPAICSRSIGSAAIAIRCSDWSHSADSRSAMAGSTTQTTGSLTRKRPCFRESHFQRCLIF